MTDTSPLNTEDPLGLASLGRTIDEATPDKLGIDRIAKSYKAVMASYEALRDRYRLLKASNRQLAEEVAWLRDQCDDFAVERGELIESLKAEMIASDSSKPNRRLEDRR